MNSWGFSRVCGRVYVAKLQTICTITFGVKLDLLRGQTKLWVKVEEA
jgi:hypothetical protein